MQSRITARCSKIEQLRRIARPARQTQHNDDALLLSVLAGFPDRVARRRAGNQVLLSSGASAELAGEPPGYEFMMAVDAEDRKDKPLPLIRMTARIEPEWLIELFPDHVREQSGVEWNRVAERVDAVSALRYDELVIQESRGAAPDAEAARELLAQKALEAGIDRFVDRDALDEFLARIAFAGFEAPDLAAGAQGNLPWLAELHRIEDCRGRLYSHARTEGGNAAAQRHRSNARPIAKRARDQGSLRTRQAALDCLSPAGFFRHAGDAADWTWADAGGGSLAGSQSPGRANDDGSGGILGAAVSPGAPGADAPVSAALLAGTAVGGAVAIPMQGAEAPEVSHAGRFSDN